MSADLEGLQGFADLDRDGGKGDLPAPSIRRRGHTQIEWTPLDARESRQIDGEFEAAEIRSSKPESLDDVRAMNERLASPDHLAVHDHRDDLSRHVLDEHPSENVNRP